MANLAKQARDKAQTAWPGASVSGRGKGWIKHQHPTDSRRFMLDTHIGPIHYGAGDDAEIDTAWEPGVLDDAPWLHKMVKAAFNVYMGPGTTSFDAGQIMRYVHPASGEDVTFQAQQLQWTNDLDQIEVIADPQSVGHTSIDDDTIYWQGAYGAGLDFRWQAQTARLAKYLTIASLAAIGSPPQFIIDGGNPALRMPFIFQKSSGVDIYIDGVLWNEKSNNPQTTLGNVEFRLSNTGESLWWFKQAAVSDSSLGDTEPPIPQQRFRATAQNLFVEVLVPWTWLHSAVYPVEIDPTIDEQVGASADDGAQASVGTNGVLNAPSIICDYPGGAGLYEYLGFRWAVSGIASGDTVNVATIDVRTTTADDPYLDIDFEDADNPSGFATTLNNLSGRTLTANAVAWNTTSVGPEQFVTTPSVVTPVQAVVDRGGWAADNYMVALFVCTDSSGRIVIRQYDGDTSYGAKLHIEYTTGGVSIPVIMHHYRQQGMS